MPVAYRLLGRLTGAENARGCPVVASTNGNSQEGALDELGFFELELPSGVHRLEITLPTTRVVVPQLEVGAPQSE
jgi:hypothetical protein